MFNHYVDVNHLINDTITHTEINYNYLISITTIYITRHSRVQHLHLLYSEVAIIIITIIPIESIVIV